MDLYVNTFQALALAIMVFYIGKIVKRRVQLLNDYCIPAPVIGGVLFAIVNLCLFSSGLLKLHIDVLYQDFFMTLFFTTIGYTASVSLLKQGGSKVARMVLLCACLIFLQDSIGSGIASFFNLQTLLGLATGSIPMVGGHGTAGAFGPLLESIGVENATTVAVACATFGLIAGSILGGPIAGNLIKRHHLIASGKKNEQTSDRSSTGKIVKLDSDAFMDTIAHLFLAMGLGTIVTKGFMYLGMVFPSYIGSMLIAAIICNLADKTQAFKTHPAESAVIGNFSLNVFLSMALMTLRLWELVDLAGPLLVALLAQVLLISFFAYFVVFNFMGRDYEAAVMSAAVCGFGMGATPNAMANMNALTVKYGPAPQAFFVVPLVGGLFVDFVNASILTLFINICK